MKAAGYRTAFLGKWHMGNDPTPRPGWDYWVAMPGQGRSTDPELFEDGALHKVPGYMTDLLTDRAVVVHPAGARTAVPAVSRAQGGPSRRRAT